jgi:hypothetical protein
MEYNNWCLELAHVLIEEVDGLEDGLAHIKTEEGYHESVFEDGLNELVIFCQCSRVGL